MSCLGTKRGEAEEEEAMSDGEAPKRSREYLLQILTPKLKGMRLDLGGIARRLKCRAVLRPERLFWGRLA